MNVFLLMVMVKHNLCISNSKTCLSVDVLLSWCPLTRLVDSHRVVHRAHGVIDRGHQQ